MTEHQKLTGYDFFRTVLGSPTRIVGPMVDHSEYAWRILSRRYGAQLTYSPMFHARLFASDAKYRSEHFTTGPDDFPMIVQFCANDADFLLEAAKLVESQCVAVDINLGCPQGIARKGHYGAFLMDEWDLIAKMVRNLADNLTVPVTCKIRIFPTLERTLAYAKMIQDAGCSMLVVHGRLRDQKGQKTGMADWEMIRAVKEHLHIPVIANGNVIYAQDVDSCLKATGVDGIMTAEGNLYNPAIFSNSYPAVWDISREYLDIVDECAAKGVVAATFGSIRGHLFKMLQPALKRDEVKDMREELSKCRSTAMYREVIDKLQRILEPLTDKNWNPESVSVCELGIKQLPWWVVQPSIRPEQLAYLAAALPTPATTPTPIDALLEPTSLEISAPSSKPLVTVADLISETPIIPSKRAATDSVKTRPKKRKLNICSVGSCNNIKSEACHLAACRNCCRKSLAALFAAEKESVEGEIVLDDDKGERQDQTQRMKPSSFFPVNDLESVKISGTFLDDVKEIQITPAPDALLNGRYLITDQNSLTWTCFITDGFVRVQNIACDVHRTLTFEWREMIEGVIPSMNSNRFSPYLRTASRSGSAAQSSAFKPSGLSAASLSLLATLSKNKTLSASSQSASSLPAQSSRITSTELPSSSSTTATRPRKKLRSKQMHREMVDRMNRNGDMDIHTMLIRPDVSSPRGLEQTVETRQDVYKERERLLEEAVDGISELMAGSVGNQGNMGSKGSSGGLTPAATPSHDTIIAKAGEKITQTADLDTLKTAPGDLKMNFRKPATLDNYGDDEEEEL